MKRVCDPAQKDRSGAGGVSTAAATQQPEQQGAGTSCPRGHCSSRHESRTNSVAPQADDAQAGDCCLRCFRGLPPRVPSTRCRCGLRLGAQAISGRQRSNESGSAGMRAVGWRYLGHRPIRCHCHHRHRPPTPSAGRVERTDGDSDGTDDALVCQYLR